MLLQCGAPFADSSTHALTQSLLSCLFFPHVYSVFSTAQLQHSYITASVFANGVGDRQRKNGTTSSAYHSTHSMPPCCLGCMELICEAMCGFAVLLRRRHCSCQSALAYVHMYERTMCAMYVGSLFPSLLPNWSVSAAQLNRVRRSSLGETGLEGEGFIGLQTTNG